MFQVFLGYQAGYILQVSFMFFSLENIALEYKYLISPILAPSKGKICTKILKKQCTEPLCTTLELPRAVRDKIDSPPPGFFGQKRF